MVGVEKAKGLSLYKKAVYAPSKDIVKYIKDQFGPKTTDYLSKFDDETLYRSHSCFSDLINISQGAESQINSSVVNCIRAVEPQSMMSRVVEIQRRRFMERRKEAIEFDGSVPPRIQKHMADLITKSRFYQDSVHFLPKTNVMEATVNSRSDATVKRGVKISDEPQTPP